MSPEEGYTNDNMRVWVDEAKTITWSELMEVAKLMDESDIPYRGRKLLSEDGVMIMDERPIVFRPFPKHDGGPRISKHRRARKLRHAN